MTARCNLALLSTAHIHTRDYRDTPMAPAPARIDRLVAVIRNEVPRAELERDLEATFDAVNIMSACYESARSGNWIPLFRTRSAVHRFFQ